MRNFLLTIPLFGLVCAPPALADQPGTAGGHGVIERFIAGDDSGNTEQVPFLPRYSFSYVEGTGTQQTTWIVLTDKDPPIDELLRASDRSEARRLWCAKANASFVALKLDSKSAVDLYFLCPGNGNINTEMLSTINGLESVVVTFDTKTDTRLKGSLIGGQGSCPDAEGKNRYCNQTSDYTFDAPIVRP